ncbi:MAG: type II restriction endonuclease [Marinilabiliaceae bacterium]
MDRFERFMSQLKETNQTLEFFCDFDKISQNVEEVRLSLHMLNSLIGSTDLRKSVETIWRRDKTAFDVLDILIAVRRGKRKLVIDEIGSCVAIDSFSESVDGVLEFLRRTGLAEVLQQQKINNLVDYIFGIETGLDSNARKNRSGHAMESMVANILDKNGINYRREVCSSEWKPVAMALGDDKKRFDFVVGTGSITYLIEVNFYSSGGSKLNEVARSYSEIAPRIDKIPAFEFVWITDGVGWCDARNKLKEAFGSIRNIYNLTSVKEFIDKINEI